MSAKQEKIMVIGAGLVGSLLSIYLARRGYHVEVYDKNQDILESDCTTGKSSINLTLCDRGFRVLDDVGVGDLIRRVTIPVYGRLIHDTNGNVTFQRYGNSDQALYSIFRHDLNKILLQFTKQNYDVDFHFNERCMGIDLSTNTATFKNQKSGDVSYREASRIFGADGAFSAVRLQLQKTDRFDFSQQYMEYGYREITIPAGNDGWIAEKNAIHFWPRGDYMLMGFANANNSFTLSLHMPIEGQISFESIRTREDLLSFFERSFPDAVLQISAFTDDYFAHSTNSMITIRCCPWNFQDKVALIGDAAHAMVPYYGQGANAGFEDCAVLDACMEMYGENWSMVFSAYERLRRPNTDAIADLGLHNFIELRELVGNPKFLLRKEIERKIHRRYPDRYATLYSMIAFSSIPYVEAIRIYQDQHVFLDQIMDIEGIESLNDVEIDMIIDEVMQDELAYSG